MKKQDEKNKNKNNFEILKLGCFLFCSVVLQVPVLLLNLASDWKVFKLCQIYYYFSSNNNNHCWLSQRIFFFNWGIFFNVAKEFVFLKTYFYLTIWKKNVNHVSFKLRGFKILRTSLPWCPPNHIFTLNTNNFQSMWSKFLKCRLYILILVHCKILWLNIQKIW